MNAPEFFQIVVKPNYEQFINNRTDLRLLWNAIVSMNTVAEFVALHRLGYYIVSRTELDNVAKQIRLEFASLSDVKFCAETFKHVRKIPRGNSAPASITASSTGFTVDQVTWRIDPYDPVEVLHKSFSVVKTLPELQ